MGLTGRKHARIGRSSGRRAPAFATPSAKATVVREGFGWQEVRSWQLAERKPESWNYDTRNAKHKT